MKRTELRRSAPMRRGKRVNRVNRKRRASEFERAYHSKARVEWMRSLPSVLSGDGPCDNVHVSNGGAGRKADYTEIVPLTREEHRELHTLGIKSFEAKYADDLDGLTLEQLAQRIEMRWKLHIKEKS